MIEAGTQHTQVFILLILVAIASILLPFQERLEHTVKAGLVRGHGLKLVPIPGVNVLPTDRDPEEPLIFPS